MNTDNTSRPGKVVSVTSTANPVVKHVRGLALKKNRDAEGLFMAEGLKLVTEAMDSGWKIRTLIYSPASASGQHLQQIAARAKASGAHVLVASDKVLSAISRKDNPQMVIGVFEQRWSDGGHLAKLLTKPGDVVLALDRVRDPGNLGTIMRTADACGVGGMILIGQTTDPYSLEAVRSSMGSVFNMPIARMSEEEFIKWKGSLPARLAGTHLEGAVDYRSIAWSGEPVLLLMGNEQQGLTETLASACDDLVLIPMVGKADSLNLAIATGVLLFEIRRESLIMPDGKRSGSLSFSVDGSAGRND
jgi:TrmH family RNA methyltransferase